MNSLITYLGLLIAKNSFAAEVNFKLKLSLKRGTKWRLVIILTINLILNGGKLSIQFPKLGKQYSKKVKVIAQMFGKKGILKKLKNSQENSTVTSKGVFLPILQNL